MKKKTIEEFCLATSSKSPTPGGGGVSSLVAALASNLAEMSTNLTIGKPKYILYTGELESIQKELQILSSNLLECINKDAEAFLPLSKAYKMDKEDPSYLDNLEKCLINAANSPMLILKYCSRIIDLDERLSHITTKISVSDVATSIMLAHGAMYGAFVNIKVNTALMSNQEYAKQMDDEAVKLLDEYTVLALNVYDDIVKRITQ